MKWIKIFSRQYSIQYCCVVLLGPSLYSNINEIVILSDGTNTTLYFVKKEYEEFKLTLTKRNLDLDNVNSFLENFEKAGELYVSTSLMIHKMTLSQLSNKELLDLYNKYYDAYLKYTWSLWEGWIVNETIPKMIAKMLQTKTSNPKYLEYASTPIKPTIIQRLAKEKSKDIEYLFNKYQWIPCLDIEHEPYNKQDFTEFVNSIEIKENNVIDISNLNLTKGENELIKVGKILSYIKDQRDDYRRKGVFYSRGLFKEIGKRLSLNKYDASYLTNKEIIDNLKYNKKFNSNIISERKKGYLVYLHNKKIQVYTGEEINNKLQEIGFDALEEESNEIKGISASKGIASGPAKIVTKIKDLDKVQQGDILVSITTHPNYLPAMKKSAAIITDEGGLTSHAAVVCRELGKPCIVNTKNGTSIFKDGDIIKVDANIGAVLKKLS